MTSHLNLRIVINMPDLINRIDPKTIKLEDWQKQELIREIFDVMELNFNSFAKSMAMGVSVEHLSTTPMTQAQISEINKIYLELGMELWFRCKDLNLFKEVVNENSISGFIDTFPMFLEFIGPDYVILTHNEMRAHPISRPVGNIV